MYSPDKIGDSLPASCNLLAFSQHLAQAIPHADNFFAGPSVLGCHEVSESPQFASAWLWL
jgi:hypothetical protein